MRRREFVTALGAAATWPLAAHAQSPKIVVIGFLSFRSAGEGGDILAAIRVGLAETGYKEGQNLTIELRWADHKVEQLPGLAADLISRHAAVIIADGRPAALAAKTLTSDIPIVFYMGNDPVALGMVQSLNRPGGNVTGITGINFALIPKRVEVLAELTPGATQIGLLVNSTNPNAAETYIEEIETAARRIHRELRVVTASGDDEFETAFSSLREKRVNALIIANDPFFNSRMPQLASLALRHSVPAIYSYREFAAAGGLASYGTNYWETQHQLGLYAGKILNGAKPAELPVMQPTKFELVVNMKTAKALGISIPATLLATADEVIE